MGDNNEIEIAPNHNAINFMVDDRGLPTQIVDRRRETFLGIMGGVGYNTNHIIGAGIFNTDKIWLLVGSPGVILIFFIFGGFMSLLGALIYIELGIRSLPKGIGEQRYIENAFPGKKNFGHIFSFVVIIIILPGAIIADSYACAQHLLYLFNKNPVPKQYFDTDYLVQRLMSILILAIITAYNMFSNRLSVLINKILASIKICAILLISIAGLIKLSGSDAKNWNTIEELGEPKEAKLKYSSLISVCVSFILYILINTAFATSLGHDFFIDERGFNQTIAFNNTIALQFGYKLFNNNEIGAKIMSALVAISAFGSVGAMVFIYARIIKYAAATEFIPKYSYLFDNLNKKIGTPFNALLAQFLYCSIYLLLFFDPIKDIFEFCSETSQYLAMLFHGASAICLIIMKNHFDIVAFQIHKLIIAIYLIFVSIIVIISFFPPAPGQFDYYIPYVVSVAAILIGGIIWRFRNYLENLEDPGSEGSEESEGSDRLQ
ncbi:16694_t:CDS:2 [Dentiscutata heterogama]|uniref:16694_t:CDS:1 n=1 Tax=Dentiscutata heterogama TaxID=1316150 RepID=A0ACA9LL06_9GLOM|nr:16694_t:CDS:2 [Dentiscutata heterogama]